jgi:hypothetical protein
MKRNFDSAPDWFKWSMTFIERIGLPVAFCIFLAYQLYVAIPALVVNIVSGNKAMAESMQKIQFAIKENTSVLRRSLRKKKG